jgi:AAHS family 4-hydroxybenzoate transporter-like MFS transporter
MITIMFCGFPVGASIAGFAAVPILPVFGWRGVFVLAGVMPLLLVPVLILLLPESIRHLVIHGAKPERVRQLLARMNPQLMFGSDTIFVVHEERAPGIPVVHLFRQGRALPTILLWIGFFMSLIDIYLLTSWLPTVFHNAGITLSLAVIATAVFQGGGVVASLVLGSFVDRFGAYRVLTFTYFLGAVCVALLGYSHSVLAIMVCTFFAGAGVIGGQTGANALAASFYPTYIRSTGLGAGDWAHRIHRRPYFWRHYALAASAFDHRLLGGSDSLACRKWRHLSDGPHSSHRKREERPWRSRLLNFHSRLNFTKGEQL